MPNEPTAPFIPAPQSTPLQVAPLSALIELEQNRTGLQAYLPPGGKWLPLSDDAYTILKGEPPSEPNQTAQYRSALADMFTNALQVPNLGFLAGSGTSLGPVGGPSMGYLWNQAMCEPSSDALTEAAAIVMAKVRYPSGSTNIEHFLSQCDAYLSFNDDLQVQHFVSDAKAVILDACSTFLQTPQSDISAYRHLLQKLARRRVRDLRLKVFTTNYDMCFETAASDLGMVATRPIIVFDCLLLAMRAFISVRSLHQKWRMTARKSTNLTGTLSAFNRQKSAKSCLSHC
jgi:hypothetical protein